MKKIRTGVFETNSSSTHSFTLDFNKFSEELSLKYEVEDGVLTLKGGEFGWERETYSDSLTKANYCAVSFMRYLEDPEFFGFNSKSDVCHAQQLFENVVKKYTGADEIKYDFSLDYKHPNYSYIDHQSQDILSDQLIDFYRFSEALLEYEIEDFFKNLIFSENCFLETGNDNEM